MPTAPVSPDNARDTLTSPHEPSLWLRIFLSAAFLVAALVLYALPVPAHAGSCSAQSATKTDPTTGWSWNTIWYCGNSGGAAMYQDANYNTQVATMNSTTSWFVCWRAGAQHSGGNNIWYYSLGDVPAGVWGFIPAVNVWTSTDPWPGMAQCPSAPSPGALVGKVKGNPIAIENSDGRLEVFAIHAYDNSVWHTWQLSPNGAWSAWESLGGWADQLAATRNLDGRLELFVRGSDGALHNVWQTSPGSRAWSTWGHLGGGILAMPPGQNAIAAIQNLHGRLEVFVIGTDHGLHHKWQTSPGGGWSNWDHQGGWADQIAVSRNNDGRLEVFVRGSDLAMHHKFQTAPDGPGLSDWYHRGGTIDQIAVVQNYYGELETFVIGTDHAIWHNWQLSPGNTAWYGWATLNPWLDRIYASQHPDGRLEIFGRGSDGALYRNYQLSPSSGWSGWVYEGGVIDRPFVERNQDGRLEVFTRGTDGLVYHKWESCVGCGWTGWTAMAPLTSLPDPIVEHSFRLAAKSYIAYVGSQIGSIPSCPVIDDAAYAAALVLGGPNAAQAALAASIAARNDVLLPGVATATDLGFDEFPTDDQNHSDLIRTHYRLFSAAEFTVRSQGTSIKGVSLTKYEQDAGKEPGQPDLCPDFTLAMGLAPSSSPTCFHGTIDTDRAVTFQKISDSLWTFEWRVRGHPDPLIEPSFSTVCPREAKDIWHDVNGWIDTSSGVPQISTRLDGSQFPSRRWWLNGVLQGTVPQGPFSNLWVTDQNDRSLIH